MKTELSIKIGKGIWAINIYRYKNDVTPELVSPNKKEVIDFSNDSRYVNVYVAGKPGTKFTVVMGKYTLFGGEQTVGSKGIFEAITLVHANDIKEEEL